MRIFVTGATGFVGTRVVPELIQAGHTVLALTRSDQGAKAVTALGAEPFRGELDNLDNLREGARQADGVIHLAFDLDPTNYQGVCEKDGRVIEALGDALVGTKKPLIITTHTLLGQPALGQLATEDYFDVNFPNPRRASELAAQAVAKRGVSVSVVRLAAQIHDPVKQGLVTPYIDVARKQGLVAYIGDGSQRWPAAHVTDTARLYRLALERNEPGAIYHAVAEEGITLKDIAEAVGRGLKLPVRSITAEEAAKHFGFEFLAAAVGFDLPASSAITRAKLGWNPTGPGLLADLEAMKY